RFRSGGWRPNDRFPPPLRRPPPRPRQAAVGGRGRPARPAPRRRRRGDGIRRRHPRRPVHGRGAGGAGRAPAPPAGHGGRRAGARVWGQTGNPDKAAFVTGLGADEVVTAGHGDLGAAVAPLAPTVVFDALGDGFSAAAVEALSPFGRLVSFGVSAGPTAEL